MRCKESSEATESLFTEQNIDSTLNELSKNNSTRSLILAPFNSSVSDIEEAKDYKAKDKKEIIKFCAKVRDIDRQYEKNNNGEVDNGVYNKFMYDSEQPNESICSSQSVSIEHFTSTIKQPKISPEMKSGSDADCTVKQNIGVKEIDEEVLNTIESFGYPKENVRKWLSNNELNHATTTYYLLTNYYS